MKTQQDAYEAALAEERRLRQESEARQAAELATMYNYIRGLSVQLGSQVTPIPPMQLQITPSPATPAVSNFTIC